MESFEQLFAIFQFQFSHLEVFHKGSLSLKTQVDFKEINSNSNKVVKKYPETREPAEILEDALRRAYILVRSCQERSYFYLNAMGWNIVYHFRRSQEEIDRYLRIMPLVSLVSNARFKGSV